jgi:DNA-binding LytR/AlgR family response regulator
MIVDDEVMAHQILEAFILQTEGLTLVAKCRNAMEAFARLEQQDVDLMFLDIEMPLISGTKFLRSLSRPPQVIFTTAYAEHAVEGFELQALDYLLKPFSYERFARAVARMPAPAIPAQPEEPGSLLVREKDALVKIPYADILYIEAARDYMKVHTPGRHYMVLQTMKKLEEALPPALFVRTHKSFIAGLRHVKQIKAESLVLAHDISIPLSSLYKEQVLKRYRG